MLLELLFAAGAAEAAALTLGLNSPLPADDGHPEPISALRRPLIPTRGFPGRFKQLQNRQERSHCGHYGQTQRRHRWLRYRPTIRSTKSLPLGLPPYQERFYCGFLIQASGSSRMLRYAASVSREDTRVGRESPRQPTHPPTGVSRHKRCQYGTQEVFVPFDRPRNQCKVSQYDSAQL